MKFKALPFSSAYDFGLQCAAVQAVGCENEKEDEDEEEEE